VDWAGVKVSACYRPVKEGMGDSLLHQMNILSLYLVLLIAIPGVVKRLVI
jgi:hypothetical protein